RRSVRRKGRQRRVEIEADLVRRRRQRPHDPTGSGAQVRKGDECEDDHGRVQPCADAVAPGRSREGDHRSGKERLRQLIASYCSEREAAMTYRLRINGTVRSVDVDDDTPLLWVLRDVLGMTGTKFGCGRALCGACTVHIDGAQARSCITAISTVGDKTVTTIEAIGKTSHGRAVQRAWLEVEV